MAKTSSVFRNLKRVKLAEKFANKRQKLKDVVMDKSLSQQDRFEATLKLAELPRNGAKIRVRNRCTITGRSRGYYRKFGLSRSELRDMASFGEIPGLVKSSW
ncbi:MAG: 30S ribosomal protein S14 [Alphaproteobacteria bacterium]